MPSIQKLIVISVITCFYFTSSFNVRNVLSLKYRNRIYCLPSSETTTTDAIEISYRDNILSVSDLQSDSHSHSHSHSHVELPVQPQSGGDIISTINSNDNSNKKFFIETHGCQMNLADSEVIRSVLLTEKYVMCDVLEDADLILTNTCSIRENAEMKIYHRLKYFNFLKKKAKKTGSKAAGYPIIGVLGCMAERLKNKLLEEHGVDFIAGPDSYRSLPSLITTATTDQEGGNIVLALEETYADINPVRLAEGNTHAFVTITRYEEKGVLTVKEKG